MTVEWMWTQQRRRAQQAKNLVHKESKSTLFLKRCQCNGNVLKKTMNFWYNWQFLFLFDMFYAAVQMHLRIYIPLIACTSTSRWIRHFLRYVKAVSHQRLILHISNNNLLPLWDSFSYRYSLQKFCLRIFVHFAKLSLRLRYWNGINFNIFDLITAGRHTWLTSRGSHMFMFTPCPSWMKYSYVSSQLNLLC